MSEPTVRNGSSLDLETAVAHVRQRLDADPTFAAVLAELGDGCGRKQFEHFYAQLHAGHRGKAYVRDFTPSEIAGHCNLRCEAQRRKLRLLAVILPSSDLALLKIHVVADDRTGLVHTLAGCLRGRHLSLCGINGYVSFDHQFTVVSMHWPRSDLIRLPSPENTLGGAVDQVCGALVEALDGFYQSRNKVWKVEVRSAGIDRDDPITGTIPNDILDKMEDPDPAECSGGPLSGDPIQSVSKDQGGDCSTAKKVRDSMPRLKTPERHLPAPVPDAETVSRIFRALGDAKRWDVYRLLLESSAPKTVSELAESVGVAHIGNFGNQLKDLEAAGLVRTRKVSGKRLVEAVRCESLVAVLRWLHDRDRKTP